MTWLLRQISIEGFRGINNAGSPLELSFHTEKVNSVFAPNGVGKSSIFEAVTFALTGAIPKLDALPAAEQGGSYYLNRFHPGNSGTITLSLQPGQAGPAIDVSVMRSSAGVRTVTVSDGRDGEALLGELNREFVLLDAKTFQRFIDDTPLNRGRSFSGLLGLGQYSALRQSLQTLANTRAFNNHFDFNSKNGRKLLIEDQIGQERAAIRESYLHLVGEDAGHLSHAELQTKAHAILYNIPLIQPRCAGKTFDQISADECLVSVREAEGGPDRDRLAQLLRDEDWWNKAIAALPTSDQVTGLVDIARERDTALAQTQGETFLRLYRTAKEITESDAWADKSICPACDRTGETSVLDHARHKVALYDAVTAASDKLLKSWAAADWDKIGELEKSLQQEGEALLIPAAKSGIAKQEFTEPTAIHLQTRVDILRTRAASALAATVAAKDEIEKRLPASLVAVTEKVEAARRLQTAFTKLDQLLAALAALDVELDRIERVRTFLADASGAFSQAESEAAARRLAAVEPLCQDLFQNIIFDPVVPAISKRAGGEDLQLSLAMFHDHSNVSAQSLLSESFRNAFAISVYLAAASLYSGAAKFLLLDDVTSSLDAGHQFHLMEVIRTRFSRPLTLDGPQVILLSHDTLLEKYFNTNGSTAGWSHQRIEGTPRTAVLPQSNAVNRVRDATLDLLNAGNAQDAAPRIRQYIEYMLEDIIIRCKIPVPMDIALGDDRRMAGLLIGAIDAQVRLHGNANSLILTAAQVQGLNIAVATITANFLSHWSSGQTQAFAPGALLGVMQAIDNYAQCFKFEPAPGQGFRYYRSLSQQ
ncbi:AAA family ATPase [Sphingopyxis sp.]|uniref:AAA family ATPase n=1 Tax=Sphingopyxis sp. TaxID=1908224 RepID=UPI002D790A6D|nr:AAA family ATPase [Sphingopyxis sp.]HET6525149.1 AAA family ATPase [Sphingopyxis sp.]